MATPAFRWAWREEENLVNSHAAARRLGGNWIAYGDEESKFLESCYRMDPKHRGTSATTLMVKANQFRPDTNFREKWWAPLAPGVDSQQC